MDHFKQKKSDYLLELALKEQLNLDKETINFKDESEIEVSHIFSKEHHNYMRQLYGIAVRTENDMKIKRFLWHTAAVFMTLAISILTVINAEAFRVSVISFLTEVAQKYTTFLQNKNYNIFITSNFQNYEPKIILDGFSVSNVKEYSNHVIISYMKFDGTWYNYHYYEEARPLSSNTEGITAKENVVYGSRTILIEEDGLLQLIMFKDRSQFMISGTISPDDAYKLLHSIN